MRCTSIIFLILAYSSPLLAQAEPGQDIDSAADASADDTSAEPVPETSGLRNGFSLSAGQQFGGDRDISATMFGIDWRIGWRVNEPVAVYLHSHLSFGSGSEGSGASGATGTFASALMGEYMLPARAFVAGGLGYGILNNPNGPVVAARAGYYPFESHSIGKARRLNVAIDYRSYSVNQGYGRVNQVQFSLGYDRF